MPNSAAVKAVGARKVVIHPHYEDAGLRGRVYNTSHIFSRLSDAELLRKLAMYAAAR
jgi:hypothetical protein